MPLGGVVFAGELSARPMLITGERRILRRTYPIPVTARTERSKCCPSSESSHVMTSGTTQIFPR